MERKKNSTNLGQKKLKDERRAEHASALTDFAEPPHNFIKSMLAKEIVEQSLADEFFDGNVSLVERKWEGLTDHQLEKFFIDRFGAGPTRAEREYSFVVYGASGYTGSLVIEYILKTVQNLGTKYTFAFSRDQSRS